MQMSGQWAGALRAASNSTPKAVSAADGGVAADSSDEEEMIQPRFSWAAALINRFGEAGGFDALQQVRILSLHGQEGRVVLRLSEGRFLSCLAGQDPKSVDGRHVDCTARGFTCMPRF